MEFPKLATRSVDEIIGEGPDRTDIRFFRDALDDASEAGLGARFAGGIVLLSTAGPGRERTDIIRPAQGGHESFLALQLTLADAPYTLPKSHKALRHATQIGVILRDGAGGAPESHVQTEVIDDFDPNQAGDETHLHSGVTLEPAPHTPRSEPDGALHVLHTAQAVAAHGLAGTQGRRGLLPYTPRQRVVRQAGLGANGRSQALAPTARLPVAGRFLLAISHRLGYARWPHTPVTSLGVAVCPEVF